MYQLAFDEELCATCETCDCLTRCQYMDVDRETARKEMLGIAGGEDSFVLHDCVTCYGCEEYCNRGNHPFYLIVQRQEENDILPLPRPLVTYGVQMAVPWRGDLEIEEVTSPVLSLGVFPQLESLIQGRLFDGVSLLSTDRRTSFHLFCQLMYLHYARISVINDRLPGVIDNIARHGVEEVIFLHDECYGTYTSYASAFGIEVPFRPIHLFEFLHGRLVELSEEIRPLGYKVAYQRPCSSRLSSDKLHFVDDIFEKIGVDKPAREYEGENALCCAGVIRSLRQPGSVQRAKEIQQRNIRDMLDAGAQFCVINCPACMGTLAGPLLSAGLMPIFMSDLCRLAIGEQPAGR
jgi:ferredoxin